MNGEQILNLAGYCFAVASVAVLVLVWVYATFQTKRDADKAEEQMNIQVLKLEGKIADVHTHMKTMRQEIKDEFRTVIVDIHSMRSEYGEIAKKLHYIVGRLEPKP